MAHRLLRDPETDGWERSDMPIVCETCLGPNPFVRMQRIEYGGLCHISNRPYTVFRWRPGSDARYKKTIICQEVAKAKNVCQVCLLDLDYNLPVQVRDQAMGITNDDEPRSDVGKEFQLHQRIKEGENGSSFNESRPNDMLMRLQRTTPYYKRNQARVCSFFAKGACTRGAECPYRHEMPTSGELADQNIKDRYYGINDPVANKMMKRVEDMPKLVPPDDQSITTLFLGGVSSDMTEEDIRDQFYSFGELASVRKVDSKSCAFVTYTSRSAAEQAASDLSGKLLIKGQRVRLSWGRPQQPQQQREVDPMQPSTSGRQQQQQQQQGYGGASEGSSSGYGSAQDGYFLYPSMAKDALGTRIPALGEAGKRPGEDAGQEGDPSKRPRTGPPPPWHAPPPGQFRPAQGMPPPVRPPQARPPPGAPPAAQPPAPEAAAAPAAESS